MGLLWLLVAYMCCVPPIALSSREICRSHGGSAGQGQVAVCSLSQSKTIGFQFLIPEAQPWHPGWTLTR